MHNRNQHCYIKKINTRDSIFSDISVTIEPLPVYSIAIRRNCLLENNKLYKEDCTSMIKKDAFETVCALDIRNRLVKLFIN